MDLKKLMFLGAAANGSGGGGDPAYVHENVSKLKFIGNPYAWMDATYANRANFIVPHERLVTSQNVTIEAHENILVLNGTNEGGANDVTWYTDEVFIPAGRYRLRVHPYVGNSILQNGKNIRVNFWYVGNTSDTYDTYVVADSVKDTEKTSTITLAQDVYKIRVWAGIASGNVYDDYRLFYSLLPMSANTYFTEQAIPASGSKAIPLSITMSEVYSMQHKSVALKTGGNIMDYADLVNKNYGGNTNAHNVRPDNIIPVNPGKTLRISGVQVNELNVRFYTISGDLQSNYSLSFYNEATPLETFTVPNDSYFILPKWYKVNEELPVSAVTEANTTIEYV